MDDTVARKQLLVVIDERRMIFNENGEVIGKLLNDVTFDELKAIQVEPDVIVQTAEAKTLRRLLWLRHGCKTPALYGDDGELQCSECMIDFKRDTAEQIEKKWYDLILLKLKTDTELQQELKILFNDSRFAE